MTKYFNVKHSKTILFTEIFQCDTMEKFFHKYFNVKNWKKSVFYMTFLIGIPGKSCFKIGILIWNTRKVLFQNKNFIVSVLLFLIKLEIWFLCYPPIIVHQIFILKDNNTNIYFSKRKITINIIYFILSI